MTARKPNNVKRKKKTEFAAQDENSLSCAVEAVEIASGKKYCLDLALRPQAVLGMRDNRISGID